jgi:hypothetical protein
VDLSNCLGMTLDFWDVSEKLVVHQSQTNVGFLYQKVILFHRAGIVIQMLSGTDKLVWLNAAYYESIGRYL